MAKTYYHSRLDFVVNRFIKTELGLFDNITKKFKFTVAMYFGVRIVGA